MSDTTDYHPWLRIASTWRYVGEYFAGVLAHQEGLMAGEDNTMEEAECPHPKGCTLQRVWVRAWREGRNCPGVG